MKAWLLLFVLWQLAACRPGSDSAADAGGQQPPDPNQPRAAGAEEVPDAFRLEPGRAGDVAINMSVEDLEAAIPVPLLVEKQITREGQEYTVYEILIDSFSHETGLVAEPDCQPDCRIVRIQVRDRKYQTSGGISIGSSYQDLRRAHPLSAVHTETGDVIAVSEGLGMSFILDSNTLSVSGPGQELQLGSIPDSALVAGILIF